MTRALGFLVGVCLTVATFVLLLDRWESRETAEGVDVVRVGNDADQALVPDPESGLANAAAQDILAPPPGESVPEKTSQASTVLLAQAGAVQANIEAVEAVKPDHASGTAEAGPRSGFADRPEDSVPEASSQASTVTAAQADGVQPDQAPGRADAASQHRFETFTTERSDHLDLQSQLQADDYDREQTGYTRTHLFWSPFHSAWAAQGFATRLTASTQVPVEVINAGPGNYRVAFNYQDESERLAHIERIETITGLQLE